MEKIINDYKYPIVFGLIALILAILLITIGFLKTLVLVVVTALGIVIGFYIKNTGLLDNYFRKK
ncbi:MAG: DUF2273 domain-containing protein [Lactococcus plantarum]|nr:DUF2273 domain-containing protein [Lactococcus plantarum]MDN6084246.1 DUF2273 domain-containing protein [Lactococcus plantarum]